MWFRAFGIDPQSNNTTMNSSYCLDCGIYQQNTLFTVASKVGASRLYKVNNAESAGWKELTMSSLACK
jgi:hypothetical protein